MLYMVIEYFKPGSKELIGKRFQQHGRMLPAGVTYHASWVEAGSARCYQVMEAAEESLLQSWIDHWADLIDFEIIPVLTSADFWAREGRQE